MHTWTIVADLNCSKLGEPNLQSSRATGKPSQRHSRGLTYFLFSIFIGQHIKYQTLSFPLSFTHPTGLPLIQLSTSSCFSNSSLCSIHKKQLSYSVNVFSERFILTASSFGYFTLKCLTVEWWGFCPPCFRIQHPYHCSPIIFFLIEI